MNPKIRTFRAESMPAALALVKRAFGPDAVILGSRTVRASGIEGFMGRNVVEITASSSDTHSPAPRAARPTRPTRPVAAKTAPAARVAPPSADLPPLGRLQPYYVRLVQQDVSAELARRLVQEAAREARQTGDVSGDALTQTVRRFIAKYVPTTGGLHLEDGKTRRVALVGPAGGGKTTTLAKLAANFKLKHRKNVALLSLDTQRLAAHDQLKRYGEIIGVPVYAAQTVAEVKEQLPKIKSTDLLLIDTPGVGLREQARFARLAALVRSAKPDETHLVLPASLGAASQEAMAAAFAPLGVTGVVLTHLDDAVGFGVVLNLMSKLECSLSYITGGQRVPTDIEEACGARFAELLFSNEG